MNVNRRSGDYTEKITCSDVGVECCFDGKRALATRHPH